MTTQACQLTPVVRDGLASGIFIEERWRTQNEQDLAALLAGVVDFGWWPGAATGKNLRGYSGASTDELGNYGRTVLTAGSTSSIVNDGATGQDCAVIDGSADSCYYSDVLNWSETNTTACTWVHIFQFTSAPASKVHIAGQKTHDGGENALINTNANLGISFSNKNIDNPVGSKDSTSTGNGVLSATGINIMWVSNEGSATPEVALGMGSSATPLQTDTWSNPVSRGGAGMQFGCSISGSAMTGRWFRSIRIPLYHTQIRGPRGTPIFADILALLSTIYGVS